MKTDGFDRQQTQTKFAKFSDMHYFSLLPVDIKITLFINLYITLLLKLLVLGIGF